MRTFAMLTVGGVAGVVLLKLLSALIIPVLGLFLGLLAMTVKLALIAAVVFFVISVLRKRRDEQAA